MKTTCAIAVLATLGGAHAFVAPAPRTLVRTHSARQAERINTSVELDKPKVCCVVSQHSIHGTCTRQSEYSSIRYCNRDAASLCVIALHQRSRPFSPGRFRIVAVLATVVCCEVVTLLSVLLDASYVPTSFTTRRKGGRCVT